MSVEVVMPKMGESIQEGKILRWLKKPGDTIERDETLLEISTDKVDTEVPSPVAGVVAQLLFQENDTVEVGKVIAIIGNSAADVVSAPSAPVVAAAPAPVPAPVAVPAPAVAPAPVATAAPSNAGAIDVVMPKMGESIQEGKVLRWLKNIGDRVERDETLLEISTDKVDTEVPSPVAGTLVERLANEGDVMEVGKVLARISSGAAVAATAAASSAPVPAPVPASASAVGAVAPAPVSVPAATVLQAVAATNGAHAAGQPIPRTSGNRFYSPLVRTIAQAEGVSLAELDAIAGTGIGGRVTKNDLSAYIANRGARPVAAPVPSVAAPSIGAPSAATPSATAPSAPTLSMGSDGGSDREVIPMDRVRTLIADHMVRSKLTSPHVTSVAEADITGIVRLRESRKGSFEKQHGFKLTLTPFFVQAIVDAVKQFPLVNVSVDGSNIIRYKNVNLGFATLLPDGNLIVPVIKKSEMLSTHGIAASINDLASRARSKKLSPDDIQGGTISLTNMGPWGSLFGTPVINQPQTAIIGVYAVQKRPVVREINGEDAILIRHMMYVSITYDHRVIDGALGSGCLNAIVKNLEAMNAETVSI